MRLVSLLNTRAIRNLFSTHHVPLTQFSRPLRDVYDFPECLARFYPRNDSLANLYRRKYRKLSTVRRARGNFRATSRWCVQITIHVRSTFQMFVERRSLYLVVFLRFLSGDRSVILARVTRNLPSENRRQGHPFLNHLVPFVWSLHPKARTHRSIERTTSPDSGKVVVTSEKIRFSRFVDHRSDTTGIRVSRRFGSHRLYDELTKKIDCP